MVIALCKVTSAETLTAQLKQKQYRSKESVIAMMQRKAQDEEIETGASTLRLTCPLTYVRMVTPCRANTCDHIQCFDALSFYSMNEQSPQWQCPVCSQDIKSEDLRMDGYVEDILRRVPHDLEAVLVEADGSWHSADDKYTSDSPILAEPSAPETEALDLLDLTPSPPPSEMASTIPPSFVAKAEVATPPVGGDSPMLSLDMSATSFSTPRISPIRPGPTLSTLSTPPPPPPANVIDLTLSSDDES
ncbi:E3 SUMO-protein ligase Pli1 [Malassezia pachydermatis]